MRQPEPDDHRYRCHQCYSLVNFEDIAHVDMYFDLCWIQCDTCEVAFGPTCGTNRSANPHPHGYFECPLRPPPPEVLPENVRQFRKPA